MWLVDIILKVGAGFFISLLWNLFLYLIDYGVYRLRHKDEPKEHDDMFQNICIANFILISIYILITERVNWVTDL